MNNKELDIKSILAKNETPTKLLNIQIIISALIEIILLVFLFVGVGSGFNGILNIGTFVNFIINIIYAPRLAFFNYLLDCGLSVFFVFVAIRIIIHIVDKIKICNSFYKSGVRHSLLKQNIFLPAKDIVLFALFVLICKDISGEKFNTCALVSLLIAIILYAILVIFDTISNDTNNLNDKILYVFCKIGLIFLGAIGFLIFSQQNYITNIFAIISLLFGAISLKLIGLLCFYILGLVFELIFIINFIDVLSNIGFVYLKGLRKILASPKSLIKIAIISLALALLLNITNIVNIINYSSSILLSLFNIIKIPLIFLAFGIMWHSFLKER
jgi:hypothetical protein